MIYDDEIFTRGLPVAIWDNWKNYGPTSSFMYPAVIHFHTRTIYRMPWWGGFLKKTKSSHVNPWLPRNVSCNASRGCQKLKGTIQNPKSLISGKCLGFALVLFLVLFLLLKIDIQLMVNCWFGARWFGFLESPKMKRIDNLGCPPRIPNHRAPNQQLTISWDMKGMRKGCFPLSLVRRHAIAAAAAQFFDNQHLTLKDRRYSRRYGTNRGTTGTWTKGCGDTPLK